MKQASAPITASGDLPVNADSFLRHLRADNLSERTQQTYMEAIRQFAAFLTAQGMPSDIEAITREHIETFIGDLLAKWKPATANNRYRGLQTFFKWAADEGEIRESPMVRMKPPKVPEQAPAIL